MNSIFLLLPNGVTIDDFLALTAPVSGRIAPTGFPDRYSVEVDDWHIYVGAVPDWSNEFDDDSVRRIRETLGPRSHAIEIEYSKGTDHLFKVLKVALPQLHCMVDNDHGFLGSCAEYLERITADRAFDGP